MKRRTNYRFQSGVSLAGERSAQTSRHTNEGSRQLVLSRMEKVPEGWMHVGKILYNPNEVLGRGCEGTVVYRSAVFSLQRPLAEDDLMDEKSL